MKLIAKLLILFATTTLFSCHKEEIKNEISGNIEFAIDLTDPSKSAVDSLTSRPAAVIITVEDTHGSLLYKNKSLNILASGKIFTTEPLSMDPGTYSLTKFMIVDQDGKAIHAVPMSFSLVAVNMDNTLPVSFNVQAGGLTHLTPVVISTHGFKAQDFGYASFDINEQGVFSFFVNPLIYNDVTYKLESTDALVKITTDTEDKSFQVSPANNKIEFNEGSGKYIVNLTKEGYQPWTDTLTEATLLTFYSKPLSVHLIKENVPFVSFVTNQDTISKINILFKSNSTENLIINWGDGIVETADPRLKASHEYGLKGNHAVTVSGKIEALYKLILTQCNVVSADLNRAKNLSSIEISRNSGLTSLDLTGLKHLKELLCVEGSIKTLNLTGCDSLETLHCSVNKLESLYLAGKTNLKVLFCDRNNLKDLDISQQSNLNNLFLSNNPINNFNANRILQMLYQTVLQNPRKGQINMTLTLSDEGKAMKESLEKQYGWLIYSN